MTRVEFVLSITIVILALCVAALVYAMSSAPANGSERLTQNIVIVTSLAVIVIVVLAAVKA